MTDTMRTPLEERVARLERLNRRLSAILTLFVMLSGVIVFAGAAQNGGQVIEAERFVVRDTKGRLRGEFGINASGTASMTIWDDQKKIAFRAPQSGDNGQAVTPDTAKSPRTSPKAKTKSRTRAIPRAMIRDGMEVTVSEPTGGDAIIAVDINNRSYDDLIKKNYFQVFDPNYNRLEDAKVAKDRIGIDQMVSIGNAIRLPSGTAAQVIDSGVPAYRIGQRRLKIRILEGEHEGKACWVPDTYVNAR